MRGSQDNWLPTRVIDIGSDDTAPKVFLTSKIQASSSTGPYVALSHCWGNHQPLTLLSSNLSQFQLELPMASMPRTFLDAIHVTRTLGFRYLWIDSLCIIQDDRDDWKREATRMLQVYRNSILTIVADAGPDASNGLSSPSRRNEWKQSQMPQAEYLHTRQARLDFVTFSGLATHCPGREERSWVSARGWTFQERLIPPRKLHFGPYEAAWECRRLQACECAGEDPVEKGRQRETSAIFTRFWQDVEAADNFAPLWMRLVEEYTMRQLSVQSDTLPALAGVAALIAERHERAIYLAGLWKEYLSEMLMWKVDAGSGDARRHGGYYAPTWTWASRVSDEGCRISFERFAAEDVEIMPGFEICDARCTYPDDNILLPPVDGFIDLGAQVAELSWHRGSASFFVPGLVPPGPSQHVNLPTFRGPTELLEGGRQSSSGSHGPKSAPTLISPPVLTDGSQGHLDLGYQYATSDVESDIEIGSDASAVDMAGSNHALDESVSLEDDEVATRSVDIEYVTKIDFDPDEIEDDLDVRVSPKLRTTI